MRDELERAGYSIVPDVLAPGAIAELIATIDEIGTGRSMRGGRVFGARNLLKAGAIETLTRTGPVRSLVEGVLGRNAAAVRGLFFDKVPGANWPVAWHQDLTIAVKERRDLPGWTNWSMKSGVVHVQPPVELLHQILTVRVHLDECGPDNGPLRVLPSSHRLGLLSRDRLRSLPAELREDVCCAALGSALFMRPLLVHASSAANKPAHRRVLHLEFARDDLLPSEMKWAAA